MLEGILRLFAARPLTQVLRDIVDIFIVAWVIYRALLVLRGTRAIQMAVGLGIVLLVYLGAKFFHFVTLLNLLSWLLSSIVLIVVVVFQNDIRRALIRMGGTAWFTGGREQQSRVIDEVVAAATELARHRMGALIAFEQDANVLEFVKSEGIQLDCVVTRELLVSLFVPESVNKLHDGAVLIRDLKIARAGVFFPMPDTKILDAQLGSRHRAALGITEETDAVVVVVSEERGTISFCFSGNIVSNLDGQSLRHALLGLFGRSARKKRAASTAKKTPAPGSIRAPAPPPPARPPAPSSPLGTIKTPPATKLVSTPMREANRASDTAPVTIDYSKEHAKGDAGKGDLAKGELTKGELAKGDLAKGDAGKGEHAKGDLAKGELTKGEKEGTSKAIPQAAIPQAAIRSGVEATSTPIPRHSSFVPAPPKRAEEEAGAPKPPPGDSGSAASPPGEDS